MCRATHRLRRNSTNASFQVMCCRGLTALKALINSKWLRLFAIMLECFHIS